MGGMLVVTGRGQVVSIERCAGLGMAVVGRMEWFGSWDGKLRVRPMSVARGELWYEST